MTNYKYIGGIVLALVIGLVVGRLALTGKTPTLGQVQNDIYYFTGGVQVGQSGTTYNMIANGSPSTCTASSSVPAGSSVVLECAVSGMLSTDTVLHSPGGQMSSASLATIGTWASSTANGYLEIKVSNASTTAITSTQADVRKVDYVILR